MEIRVRNSTFDFVLSDPCLFDTLQPFLNKPVSWEAVQHDLDIRPDLAHFFSNAASSNPSGKARAGFTSILSVAPFPKSFFSLKLTYLCSNAFPEPAKFVPNIRTQARPGRTVRTWRLIFASLPSTWNYQKRFIVNGSGGGFSTHQWLCCSSGRASAHVGGPNLPMSEVIYHHLLNAKILFLTEMVIVEVLHPQFRRIKNPALYNVGLLSFLNSERD
jgi:hypothetical protein